MCVCAFAFVCVFSSLMFVVCCTRHVWLFGKLSDHSFGWVGFTSSDLSHRFPVISVAQSLFLPATL